MVSCSCSALMSLQRTISRWMKRAPRDPEPARRWLTFLRNHREAIAAMDFFTVPTITFSSLYCFFVISHDRRRILHFNITKHPTSSWIVQQLREAFPFGSAPRFVIFDRDAKYGLEVPAAVRSLRVNPLRTSFESPWQNGVAERWVGSCRRDLLDHIIAVDERHLKRRLSEYIRYYHEDRTHLGLGKGTPDGRTRTVAAGHVLLTWMRQPSWCRSKPLNQLLLINVFEGEGRGWPHAHRRRQRLNTPEVPFALWMIGTPVEAWFSPQ
jgi:transposase InsO family protein